MTHEMLHVRQLRFLGEQDGVPERVLKHELARLFAAEEEIWRAYLARVDFGSGTPVSVALCLKTVMGANATLVDKVQKAFASQFHGGQHLDIIFIDDNQDFELSQVCEPFYMVTQNPSESINFGPYAEMTVNERLWSTGQMQNYDEATRRGDRKTMIGLLTSVDITPRQALWTVDQDLCGKLLSNQQIAPHSGQHVVPRPSVYWVRIVLAGLAAILLSIVFIGILMLLID